MIEKEAWFIEVEAGQSKRAAPSPLPSQHLVDPSAPPSPPTPDIENMEHIVFIQVLPYLQQGFQELSQMWGRDSSEGAGYADLAEDARRLESKAKQLRGV